MRGAQNAMRVVRYEEKYQKRWDSFVKQSKNGTFLFQRNYIEYHSHRFEDFSLLVVDANDGVLGLLPGSISGAVVSSHGGLTFGGLLLAESATTLSTLRMLECLVDFLRDCKIKNFIYKAIPHIYHSQPSEEDLYALFRCGFTLKSRAVSSSFRLKEMKIKGQKLAGYKKASKVGFTIRDATDSTAVLQLVNDRLTSKYGVSAVHSADEMNLLKKRFKRNILIYELVYDDEVCGGAILYIDNGCAHAQYITTNDTAKANRGLDFIIVSLVELLKVSEIWFDYGTSTEQGGRVLNENLIKSKEEFNMSAVCYDVYELVLND